jgi:hypothetical protein
MTLPEPDQYLRTFFPACFCALLAGCASPHPAFNTQDLRIGPSSIHIEMARDLALPPAAVVEWVRRAGVAVTAYLGWFPVKHLTVTVRGGGEQPVGDGVTHGASSIEVRLGPSAREWDLSRDWVMTHEMFHLAFPTLDRRYLWMMEGLSDYLEPVARARVGQCTAQDAWREFVQGLPQGLPTGDDGGLDNARRRERIYWGGNIYWLLADVWIRVRTDNRRSLEDVIRAILAAGGNGGANWPLDRVLAVGGRATGTTVLKDLYEQLGPKPGKVDLDTLWQQLGVRYLAGAIDFEENAPWAKYRAAITAPVTGVR